VATSECPDCEWSPDEEGFVAYCEDCGSRTEVVGDFETVEDTRSDKI
jgi:Zn finger protein HypA/HybF involved in hydrogenase expression